MWLLEKLAQSQRAEVCGCQVNVLPVAIFYNTRKANLLKCGVEGADDGTAGCVTYLKKGIGSLEAKDTLRQQQLDHMKNF